MKTTKLAYISIFLLLLILFEANMNVQGTISKNNSNTLSNHISRLTSHKPLTISGNSQLLNLSVQEGWSGNGTETNPFMIENYTILSGTIGLEIKDTSLFITVGGNTFYGSYNYAIMVSNSNNVTIKNNYLAGATGYEIEIVNSSVTLTGNNLEGQNDVFLLNSANCTLNNNKFSIIFASYLYLEKCFNITIESNTFIGSGSGGIMTLKNDFNCTFNNNTVLNTIFESLFIQQSKFITVQSNIFFRLDVALQGSETSIVNNNTLFYSSINLDKSYFNTIEQNIITNESIDSFAINLNYANNNTFFKNYIYDTYYAISFFSSSWNVFHKNYLLFQNTPGILIQGIEPNSSYNVFYDNNFISPYIAIKLGFSINYFNYSTIGNFWSNYSSTSPYYIYKSPGFNLIDYHPLINQSFTPNNDQLVRNRNIVNRIMFHQPTTTPTTYTSSSTSYVNPIGGVSTFTKSSFNAITISSSFGIFIIIVMVIFAVGAVGYITYEKSSIKNTTANFNRNDHSRLRLNRNNSVHSDQRNTQGSYPDHTSTSQPYQEQQNLYSYCPFCHTQIEPSDSFCFNCGNQL